MKKILIVLLTIVVGFNARVKADEGMWLLPLLEQLNMGTMTELGLKLSAEEIYSLNQPSLVNAVVSMGRGFCTGEIVSSQGLLFTNHHCGYGFIQSHSTVENDYLKDGFWAMKLEDELPNPGLYVRFLVRIEDVSDRVLKGVGDDLNEEERASAIRTASNEISGEATKDNNYSATVSAFFGGNNYYLLVYESYNDVRLVGAPPSSIGKYGHDTDNWEWPRHTGDFSIFRVYMGPDGKPADYSPDNIPLKPKYHLPVSIKGVTENDFAMVMGYPGRTTRYMTSYEIDEALTITHPNQIKLRGLFQEVWMEDMIADQKVNIQYAGKYSGFSNYWKNSIGMKAGLEKLHVKERKAEIENRFTKWVGENRKREKKYGEALNLIKAGVEGRAVSSNVTQYLRECFLNGSELPGFSAIAGSYLAALRGTDQEAIKKEADNLIRRSEPFYKDYNYPTDRKATKVMFKTYMTDIDPEYWPGFMNTIKNDFGGDVDKYVDAIFDNSIFITLDKLKEFIANPDAEKLASDPAFVCGQSIVQLNTELRNNTVDYRPQIAKGHRLFIAGLREMDPDIVRYSDANSTMRLSYGTVLPYEPRDGVIYKYYTTMDGVLEKYVAGDYEFDLPLDFIELAKAKKYGRYAAPEGYMPVGFLTNNDITGGNSGSPVINGNGELIGLAFDGNWEAMSGDVAFEPDLQRCINVDIRYVLWVIDIYAGATRLIEEMDIRD